MKMRIMKAKERKIQPLPGPTGGLNKMSDLLKNTFRCVMLKYVPWNWLVYIEPRFLKPIPDDLKTEEMCNEAIEKVPRLVDHVRVCFRTFGMCFRALEKCLHSLRFILDHLKTQGGCKKVVEEDPYLLGDFPDCFKTKRMYERLLKMNQRP